MSIRCPNCFSSNVSRERSPNGSTHCIDCLLSLTHREWDARCLPECATGVVQMLSKGHFPEQVAECDMCSVRIMGAQLRFATVNGDSDPFVMCTACCRKLAEGLGKRIVDPVGGHTIGVFFDYGL